MVLQEGTHSLRHTANDDVLQEEVIHPVVDGLGDGDFLLQALVEKVDDLRRDAVCPQEFLKVQRVHVHDGLVTHRD